MELEEGRGGRWGGLDFVVGWVKSNDESISINAEGLRRSTAYLGAEVGDDGVLGGGAGQLVEFGAFFEDVAGGGAGQLVEFGAIVEDVAAEFCDVGGKGEGGEDFTTFESSSAQFGGVWGEGY